MPLPIGFGQTISQPYIVALMTSLLSLRGGERVLEVGTGSGYQAAILGRLSAEVHSVEWVADLAVRASHLLGELGCDNVHVHEADGGLGWKQAAPYSAIIVTAASPRVPEPLLGQMTEGARLVAPVDYHQGYQSLVLLELSEGKVTQQSIANVSFVPLRGKYGWPGER
jgi:protein-L-isoaspartate(D-aspartate) O-methyltransferase